MSDILISRSLRTHEHFNMRSDVILLIFYLSNTYFNSVRTIQSNSNQVSEQNFCKLFGQQNLVNNISEENLVNGLVNKIWWMIWWTKFGERFGEKNFFNNSVNKIW